MMTSTLVQKVSWMHMIVCKGGYFMQMFQEQVTGQKIDELKFSGKVTFTLVTPKIKTHHRL